ncbi:MAG: SRPBCC family protein [SAR202 cluster bacterium]|jgi:uncharacterized protein YndB with AHSA1/START domain|nr:hypothetical protein [Chloroflexota bacterium]MDP6420929.1 SRPBCC family protein [SAR202 cluster bacterium]MDP6665127.1 SRPBCC family protein [SAR202 cluster bacterium]MDP6801340.1 SRPBCC family protein [SAR202 cluster bacterium]MQG57522.1 SRPBCC family protein [SAR202 cluster bacterium]|tara:strand:+ start:81 stop:575 length:495 start_codon:yes stop_codon:yes gene_type:complete
MVDFSYSTETDINASPQAIFDIVSDLTRHPELAGSDEIKSVTQAPAGAVKAGTQIHADETVVMGDGSTMDLTADSIVVTYDPPKSFSWIVNPALPEQVRRMQWWFNLSSQDGGTKVVHEVEIDWGDIQHEMLIGLRDNYEQIRAGVVRSGMDKTLENLQRIAGA